MDCPASNHLEWKCLVLFTIFGISHLGHFDHSKQSKWPKMCLPNGPKVFCWLLSLGKLNTQEVLQKQKPFRTIYPGWCVLCKNSYEYQNHLFLHCPFALALWSWMLQEFGVAWVWPLNCQNILLHILLHVSGIGGVNSRRKKLWNVDVLAICGSTLAREE